LSSVEIEVVHSKMLDPVLDEIGRIFELMQNSDGSWGVYENDFDKLYPTSWILKTTIQKELFDNGIQFIDKTLNSINYDAIKYFKDISKERFIKGYFNIYNILINSKINQWKLNKFTSSLLEELKNRNWFNSISTVAYIVYGLKNISEYKKYYDSAYKYLQKEVSFHHNNMKDISPEVFLAIPELLLNYITDKITFFKTLENIPDINLTIIFLASILINDKIDDITIKKLRTFCLNRLRNRQITQIDRKITKQFLDSTLLIRSGVRGASLKSRLKTNSPVLDVKDMNSHIEILIDTSSLIENFGDINLITLAIYSVSIKLIEEEYIYFLNSNEYNQIKHYFNNNSIAIPIKREFIHELFMIFIYALFFLIVFWYLSKSIHNYINIYNIEFLKGNAVDIVLVIISFLVTFTLYKLGLKDWFPIFKKIFKFNTSNNN